MIYLKLVLKFLLFGSWQVAPHLVNLHSQHEVHFDFLFFNSFRICRAHQWLFDRELWHLQWRFVQVRTDADVGSHVGQCENLKSCLFYFETISLQQIYLKNLVFQWYLLQTSVTCKKSPKFAKMKALDPLKIVKNVGNLGIIIVATGFERLPKIL